MNLPLVLMYRQDIHNRLSENLNAKGTTLIYTSHQLHEAEDLCTRIAMIDEGKIIVNDSLESLLRTHEQGGLEGLFLNYRERLSRLTPRSLPPLRPLRLLIVEVVNYARSETQRAQRGQRAQKKCSNKNV